MDDIVKQALAKWPNVPDCYGWLGLDARGNWYLRDYSAQASGPFCGGPAQSKGTRLEHARLVEFIDRNYASDASGQWFFQNGPQRVYVELEVTPYIWHLDPDLTLHSHNGQSGQVQAAVLDEQGWLYVQTDIGFGLVHSMDMGLAVNAVEQGLWQPQEMLCADLPAHFAYVTSPQTRQLQAT
jgi:hypothetical protein